MKKYIKRIIILSIILFIISFIIIQLMGKTYTTSFRINNKESYSFNIYKNSNNIKILEKKVKDNKYIVKFKGEKPGKVFLSLDYNDYSENKIFYIHKSKIITENYYFGYTRGSESIPISVSIILIYILYLLIKEYKKSTKENIYQYKNVSYLGIIIFLSFFLLINLLSTINYHGLIETINKTISSISSLSILLFPISLITFILVTISNIELLRREGKSLRNLLGLFLGIFLCTLVLLPDITYKILLKVQIVDIYNLNSPGPYIYNFIETLVYLVVTYLECVLIGTIIISIKSIRKKIEYNKDYIIILGCKTKKDGTLTPLLKGRVDKALEFRSNQLKYNNKDLIFIPSGGQGSDELIPEAESIKNYLLEQGIKEKNILVENKSTNTYENIKYSNNLIKKKDAKTIFSTTNYHVFRAGLIASEQGLKIEGIGSKTKLYYWINAFIREFIGTLYAERKKHILVLGLIIILLIITISITYISNVI